MLVKYVTRKFNLLEHSIIVESFKEAMKDTPCYVEEHADYFENGVMDVHVTERYISDGKIFAYEMSKKDNDFINTVIKNINSWFIEVKQLESNFKDEMNDKEAELFLKKLYNLMLKYGLYIELTHHINRSEIKLTEQNLIDLGHAHDERKIAFQKILHLFVSIGEIIARNNNIKQGHLNLILYKELKHFFRGEISKEEIEKLQESRYPKFMYLSEMEIETVIPDVEVNKKWEEVSKKIKHEEQTEEIKGLSVINKGIVQGEIQRIIQSTPLSGIEEGKIILVEMTLPTMTPALKKAKAIITDEGGRLCHAACVAREFGVPCVVGTKNATKLLKDGDFVEVDSVNGLVRKL